MYRIDNKEKKNEMNIERNTYGKFLTPTNNLNLCKILLSQKNEVKSLLFSYLGKARTKRKPSPLRRLEKGMQQYFFGENGIVTRKRLDLQIAYKKEKNKVLYISSSSDFFHLSKNNSNESMLINKNKTTNSLNHSSIFDELSNPYHQRSKQQKVTKPFRNTGFPKLKLTKKPNNKMFSSYSLKNISIKTNSSTIDLHSSHSKTKHLSTISIDSIRNPRKEIESKLDVYRKTHIKLEHRLFNILDNAEVKNKAAMYLKDGKDYDIEDITGKKVIKYKKPQKVKSHYIETKQLSELVNKQCKDIITEHRNKEIINDIKTKREKIKIKLFDFDLKTRKKAERNYYSIRKITFKLSKENDQFYSMFKKYSMKL